MGGFETYKSEQKTSMLLVTAFENRTIRQTLVKTGFFQSEFGIRAGRFRPSRRLCHIMKAGTKTALITSSAMFTGCRIFETEPVRVLLVN